MNNSLVNKHWDSITAFLMMVLTWITSHASLLLAALIGLATLIFVAARAFIWVLKARIAWRNRNNTNFFLKSNDDDEEG